MDKVFFSDYLKNKNKPHFIFHIEKGFLPHSIKMHNHDFSELIIIAGGNATHMIDDESYPITEGDIYVINGDTAHGFQDVHDLTFYNIMYDADTVLLLNELEGIAGFKALFMLESIYRKEHNFKSKLQLDASKIKSLIPLLDNMVTEYNIKTQGYEVAMRFYFIALVIFLSREYEKREDTGTLKILRLSEVFAFIERNFVENITLEQLAKKACLSPRQFSRVFKEIYQCSPIEHIINLQIKHACKLLLDPRLTITQIAYQSGFGDSNYFSRQFKSKLGMSPLQYRQKSYLSSQPRSHHS